MTFCCCFSASVTPTQPLLPQHQQPTAIMPTSEKMVEGAAKVFSMPKRLPDSPKGAKVQSLKSHEEAVAVSASRGVEQTAGVASRVFSSPKRLPESPKKEKDPVPKKDRQTIEPTTGFGAEQPKADKSTPLKPPSSPALRPQQSPAPPQTIRPPRRRQEFFRTTYEVTHWVIYPRAGESSRKYVTSSLKGTGLDLDD